MYLVLLLTLPLLGVIIFQFVSINKKRTEIESLKNQLNQQYATIKERLSVSDKYSKMLAEVASQTFEAVIITDKDGNIEWVNDGFTKITGYTLPEVKGLKPGKKLQGPETDPFTVERIRENLKTGKIFKEEILNYHKTGRKYWLSLSITPILNAKGEIEKFIAIESDITEQKKKQNELQEKLKQLESKSI